MIEIPFRLPDRVLVERSREVTTSYANPFIGMVFWRRYRVGFRMLQDYLRESGKERFSNALEIGTSHGFFLPSLCKISKKVIGTDIAPTMGSWMGRTLSHLAGANPNLTLIEADAERLSDMIEPSSCDLIVAFSVLEHIEDRRRAISQIRECLSSEGVFLCELPSESRLYRFGRKLIHYPEAHPNYEYRIVESMLQEEFSCRRMMNVPFGIPLFKVGLYTPAP